MMRVVWGLREAGIGGIAGESDAPLVAPGRRAGMSRGGRIIEGFTLTWLMLVVADNAVRAGAEAPA